MTARTVPTMPSFLAGQKLTAALLNQIGAYGVFWGDPPMFSMVQSVAQTVANAADTQITMDSVEFDTDTGRALSTPWAYTIPTGMGGRWRFTACVQWAGNATGTRQTKLFRNGTLIGGGLADGQAGPAGISTGYTVARTVLVNAGDVIAVYGYQTSGGNLNTNVGGGIVSYFEGRFESLANP